MDVEEFENFGSCSFIKNLNCKDKKLGIVRYI